MDKDLPKVKLAMCHSIRMRDWKCVGHLNNILECKFANRVRNCTRDEVVIQCFDVLEHIHCKRYVLEHLYILIVVVMKNFISLDNMRGLRGQVDPLINNFGDFICLVILKPIINFWRIYHFEHKLALYTWACHCNMANESCDIYFHADDSDNLRN